MVDIRQTIQLIVESLPTLTAHDLVDAGDSCPICLVSFESLLLDTDSDAGVTRLTACNHVFCRKDLTQWIQTMHGSCPTCRHTFLDVRPPSESDDESSDGGEYIPNEYEDDGDDDYDDIFIDTDGFSDAAEFGVEVMDVDLSNWEDAEEAEMDDEEINEDGIGWGSTDGETSSMSEGDDGFLESEDRDTSAVLETVVSVSVRGTDSDGEEEGDDIVREPK